MMWWISRCGVNIDGELCTARTDENLELETDTMWSTDPQQNPPFHDFARVCCFIFKFGKLMLAFMQVYQQWWQHHHQDHQHHQLRCMCPIARVTSMSGPGTPQLSGATTSMANILSRLGTTVPSKLMNFQSNKSVTNLRKLRNEYILVVIHFDRRSQGTQAGGAGGSRLEKMWSVLKRIRSGEPSPCSSSSTLEFSGPSSNLVCICEGRTLRSTTKRKSPSFSLPLPLHT